MIERIERERQCRCEVRSAFKKPSEASLKFPGLKKERKCSIVVVGVVEKIGRVQS